MENEEEKTTIAILKESKRELNIDKALCEKMIGSEIEWGEYIDLLFVRATGKTPECMKNEKIEKYVKAKM